MILMESGKKKSFNINIESEGSLWKTSKQDSVMNVGSGST